MKGEWSLPGGKLELGETLRDGVVREVREETGLTVVPGLIVEVVDRIVRDGAGRVRYHYVLVDFACSRVDGELTAGSDAEDAAWVPRSQLDIRNIARGHIAHQGGRPAGHRFCHGPQNPESDGE